MNWIKKTLHFGEKIKKSITKRITKQEMADSKWMPSCCTSSPILKASIFNDDELLKLIREQHGKYDLIEVYDQMILKHNVPVCLLTHILYECKVTMGLFS